MASSNDYIARLVIPCYIAEDWVGAVVMIMKQWHVGDIEIETI